MGKLVLLGRLIPIVYSRAYVSIVLCAVGNYAVDDVMWLSNI